MPSIYYKVIGKVELPPVYNLEEFKTIAQAENVIGDKISPDKKEEIGFT